MGTSSPHPIRVARQAQGITQLELAFKAGVALATLERIERFESTPLRSTVKVIADALGMDPADLTVEQAA